MNDDKAKLIFWIRAISSLLLVVTGVAGVLVSRDATGRFAFSGIFCMGIGSSLEAFAKHNRMANIFSIVISIVGTAVTIVSLCLWR